MDAVLADADLLRLAAAGDEHAFAEFVRRHQDGVWRRARALTRRDVDAEDLMQETFVAAWRGAATFRGGSARSWLLTIATHAWQRAHAHAAAHEIDTDTDTLEALAARAAWGAVPAESDSDPAAIVTAAFLRLTPPDREVLTLRDVDALSGDEVAAALGLSRAAMKSRLHRARLRLAAAYEEVRRVST